MQVCACVGLVLSIQQYTVYMCKCNVRMYVCWNQTCVVTYLCVHTYCRLSFLASVVNLCSMYLLDLSDKTRQEYCHFCTRYVCTTYDMVVGGTVWTENSVGQNFRKSFIFANFAKKRFAFSTPIALNDCQTITSLGVHE